VKNHLVDLVNGGGLPEQTRGNVRNHPSTQRGTKKKLNQLLWKKTSKERGWGQPERSKF